jgi:hypothetical protein
MHSKGLASLSMHGHTWGNAERARCYQAFQSRLHIAPVRGCTCGIYAKHTLKAVEDEFMSGNLMYGSIKAYGRIILGDSGFKAEYAEIEALLWHGLPIRYKYPDGGLAKILDSVPFYTSRKKFLKDYPPISVDHLLPEKEQITDRGMGWPYPAVVSLMPDQAQLQRDYIRIRDDARRASAYYPFYERKMER